MRVVGIVAPFAQQGVGRYLEQIRFIKPQGVNGHTRSVPGAPPPSGTPRESQEKFNGQNRVGIVEGSPGYRARGVNVQIRDLVRVVEIVAPLPHGRRYTGKSVQGRDCMEVAESSDPRVAYPEVKDTGHSESCGPLCPTVGRYPGKFVLSSPRV